MSKSFSPGLLSSGFHSTGLQLRRVPTAVGGHSGSPHPRVTGVWREAVPPPAAPAVGAKLLDPAWAQPQESQQETGLQQCKQKITGTWNST